MIDFGLAKSSTSAEERAVDLYVLERALVATHPRLPVLFVPSCLQAYQQALDDNDGSAVSATSKVSQGRAGPSKATLDRLEVVRRRGRKRECFG
jgi:TP53 regulating kinase and related kinases